MCDLEKRIDCIDHDILLSKLKFCEISGKVLALDYSYLDNRHCRTAIYSEGRATAVIQFQAGHGVPQGSVLGLLLFLSYTDGLPKIINKTSAPIIFADDISILFSHYNLIDFHKNTPIVFANLSKWFRAKTNYL